jgi:hypothetical protein
MSSGRAVVLSGHSLFFPLALSVPKKEIRLSSLEPLATFVQLSDVKPEEILDFANAWGPLGLCIHSLPYDHGESSLTIGSDAEVVNGRIKESANTPAWLVHPHFCDLDLRKHAGVDYVAEPLSAWRHLADGARALRDTVIRLRQHERPLKADLRTLVDTLFGAGNYGKRLRTLAGKEATPEYSRRGAWFLIGERLNEWLASAPVRFFCEIEERSGRFDVDFTVGLGLGVLPLIAAQLLATLSDPERGSPEICSGCRLPFIQTRKPSRGTRIYCLTCRKKGIPVRDAVHDHREGHRIQNTKGRGGPKPKAGEFSERQKDGKKTRAK